MHAWSGAQRSSAYVGKRQVLLYMCVYTGGANCQGSGGGLLGHAMLPRQFSKNKKKFPYMLKFFWKIKIKMKILAPLKNINLILKFLKIKNNDNWILLPKK